MKILQVNTADSGGGAEKVALDLHHAYGARGYKSWLAVGYVRGSRSDVLQIPNNPSRNPWARAWSSFAGRLVPFTGKIRGVDRVRRLSMDIAEPRRSAERRQGHEDFAFPGTKRLLELPSERPTILHCHNLHGGYFDLRALSQLSMSVPTILTLHDAWLLSGHCAHSFACGRWQTGCGHCPDLSIYPSVPRDATAGNWRRKQRVFARSRLYIATPSQWLMDKVKKSMLFPAAVDLRVIHNGVDLSVFRPADRLSVRAVLGVPPDTILLLSSANGIRNNPWKDLETMRSALAGVAERASGRRVLFVALGEDAPAEQIGSAELRFIGFEADPIAYARYYQAADVYVHAAKADTFPTTVLEALACGTPVVATAVGGIPEQVQDSRTGFLVNPGSPESMTEAVVHLLNDDGLRRRMAANAAEDAKERFDVRRQVDDYVGWYQEILASQSWKSRIG